MKHILIGGVIILSILFFLICWIICIAASDAEEWEREVHEFEDESGNENRSRDE